jgi:CheY-like chemotaxis protein
MPETAGEPTTERGRRILVVDDDPGIAAVLVDILALDGHWADAAFDAPHALERLEQGGEYALIICDIKMPGPDGPELYRDVVRRFPRLARRFIFLTGDVVGQERADFTDERGVWGAPGAPHVYPTNSSATRGVMASARASTSAGVRLPTGCGITAQG